jgi:hypothetical protein
LGLIRDLRDAEGQDQLERVVQLSGPAARQVFSQRISKLAWYPYPAFVELLSGAESVLSRPSRSASFELGRAAGKLDLGTVLRIYVAVASPERLIRSCKLVWPSYYRNAGSMEAVEWQPESTVLRIYDFPEMHRLHCRLMEGWMIATMETLGFEVANDARQTLFMADGAPYHEFCCSWQRARR